MKLYSEKHPVLFLQSVTDFIYYIRWEGRGGEGEGEEKGEGRGRRGEERRGGEGRVEEGKGREGRRWQQEVYTSTPWRLSTDFSFTRGNATFFLKS